MARTGCAFGAAISACTTARNRRRARQVLPAYGLPSLPPIHYQGFTKVLLRTIPGGHFNMAENRTFLLCVDSMLLPLLPAHGAWVSLHLAKGNPGRFSLRDPASPEKRTARNGCATRAKAKRSQPGMAVLPGQKRKGHSHPSV